ncbi:hypothetical protein P8605_09885 [Streptomyces sp. T-3]|nr:hypothetical protein [Streptomyces sp. T-3]
MDLDNSPQSLHTIRVRAGLAGGLLVATSLLVPAVAYAAHGPEQTAPVIAPTRPAPSATSDGLVSQNLHSDTSLFGPVEVLESRTADTLSTQDPGMPGPPAADPAGFGLLGLL